MKTKKKFLSFLLCFMFLFLVGCPEGGPSDFYDPATTPLAMQGVKVLSKPADYDFKEAVGKEYSENYYNLFARAVLDKLYNVYENDYFTEEEERKDIYNYLDLENGDTFSIEVPTAEERPFYLFDTLRYTISNVEKVFNSSNSMTNIKVGLDLSTSWDWTIGHDVVGKEIAFLTTIVPNVETKESDTKLTYNFNGGDLSKDWTEIYTDFELTMPNFSEFYTYPENGEVKVDGSDNTDFWISPYYNEVKNLGLKDDKAPVNYFQDALEYAIYLFVLGFDYNADAADAPYFDFEVVYDTVETSSTYGHVTDVKVGGWGAEKISVSKGGENSALGKVKKMYDEVGGYVGITRLQEGQTAEGKTNQEQIEKFIKNKIIGEKAYEKNIFQVTTTEKDASGNVTSETTQKYNRNYDKIVSNVVQYACNYAPIGLSDDGNVLTLDQNFLASQITDYQGNYFGASKKGGKDDNLFEFIPAAEYQSFVIYPNEEDFDENLKKGKFQALGDIWLAFEYWDDPRDTITPEADKNKARDKENGIVINVGFRYFDHEKGQFVANTVVKKEVSYGRFPIYKDENGKVNPNFEEEYDNHMAMFAKTDTAGCTPIGEVPIKTKFLYDIGNGAINPFASGTEIEGQETKSITITSSSRARDYYMTNASSSYGFYGTLNPDKFAGEGGCDYIEIYFDVQKTKGVLGKNYNFKVALYNFLAAEDVFAKD